MGLVTRASVLVGVAASVLPSQNGSFLEAALVRNRHFFGVWCGSGLWRIKTAHFYRPGLYRIVIFGLWYGSGG